MITFNHHNFIFSDRNASDLIIYDEVNKKEDEAQCKKDKANKKALAAETETQENGQRCRPLYQSEDEEEILGNVKLEGVCFYHFSNNVTTTI